MELLGKPSAEWESKEWNGIITEQTRSGLLRALCKAGYDLLEYGGGAANGDSGRKIHPSTFVSGILMVFSSASHLVAWNNYFPSLIEYILWNASALAICCGTLVYTVIVMVGGYEVYLVRTLWELRFYDDGNLWIYMWKRLIREREEICKNCKDYAPLISTDTKSRQSSHSRLSWGYIWRRCMFDCSWLLSGGYGLCMLFLTVEAFISMRNIPEGSQITPRWFDYWPSP